MCDPLVSSLPKSLDIVFKGNDGQWRTLSHSFPGSVALITEQHLRVTDTDSDDRQVMYIMKEDPGAGRLQMVKHENQEQISVKGPIRSFTQADISQGQLAYFLLSRLLQGPPTVVKWEFNAW